MLDEASTAQKTDIPAPYGSDDAVKPRPSRPTSWVRILLRTTVIALILLLSVAIPDFDRVMAIMGSALCCPISILLPSAFHLKLLGDRLSWYEKCVDCVLLGVGGVMTVIGTVGAVAV
jgi:amino acid permease